MNWMLERWSPEGWYIVQGSERTRVCWTTGPHPHSPRFEQVFYPLSALSRSYIYQSTPKAEIIRLAHVPKVFLSIVA